MEMPEKGSGSVYLHPNSDAQWAGDQQARWPVLVPCWTAEPRACGLVRYTLSGLTPSAPAKLQRMLRLWLGQAGSELGVGAE